MKQHGGLGTASCDSVHVRGRGQLCCGFRTLGGFGFHDLDHTVLTQLTPSPRRAEASGQSRPEQRERLSCQTGSVARVSRRLPLALKDCPFQSLPAW